DDLRVDLVAARGVEDLGSEGPFGHPLGGVEGERQRGRRRGGGQRGDRGGRGRLLHLVVEDAVDAIDRQGEPAAVREGQLGAIVGHLVGTDLEGVAVGQDHQLGARAAGRGCSHGDRGEGGGNRAAGRHGALLYGDPGRFAYPSWERSSAARRVPPPRRGAAGGSP